MIATTLTLTLTFYDCHETLFLMVMWLAGGENGGKAKNCRVLHRVLTVNQGLWVYSIFRVYSICILCVNLGIKYSLTSNFGYKAYLGFLYFCFFYMSFSIISGILVFHYPPPHPWPILSPGSVYRHPHNLYSAYNFILSARIICLFI